MMKNQKRRKIGPPVESASINDLPEVILLHIIAFLPLIDAVKTSAVARSWRNLCHSVPRQTLSFNSETFHSRIPNKSMTEVHEMFSDFISSALSRRPNFLPLHSFKLVLYKDTHNRFRSWFQSVIAANVVELDLDFSLYDVFPDTFNFDSTLFYDLVGSSVRVLKVETVYFRFPAFPLRLESIREVELIDFHSTDKEIADLIASCVHLESLSLSQGWGLKNLKIDSQKLKHLKLRRLDISSVEIYAPSLISINLSRVFPYDFALIISSASFVEAKVGSWSAVVMNLRGVERLTIQNMWWRRPYSYNYELRGDSAENIIFQNLKHLELGIWFSSNDVRGLQSLLEQCPQLEIMVLVKSVEYCRNEDYLPEDIIFKVSRLRLVEIKAFRATKIVMHIVDLLKKHGVVLEKIVAYPQLVKGKSPPPPFIL